MPLRRDTLCDSYLLDVTAFYKNAKCKIVSGAFNAEKSIPSQQFIVRSCKQ